jgi:hypothetical protein
MQQEIIKVDCDVVRRDTTDKVMRAATNVHINVTHGTVLFNYKETYRSNGKTQHWPLRSCSLNAFLERYFITLDLSEDVAPVDMSGPSTYDDLQVGDAFFDPNGILRVVLAVEKQDDGPLIALKVNARKSFDDWPCVVGYHPVTIIPINDVTSRCII